ncbi:chromatin remodeling regulator CECR2-like [Centruroides vittatus]|uniref:chromatin remodeling regulator CECR2-like n=1 Tax=Centruroides vittatus TaxID=120091 RepID=UPI003510C5DA
MDDIQSWWEIPSIAHFCSVFKAAFNLLEFDIEDLERSFLSVENDDCISLQKLIIALLQGYYDTNINVDNWEHHLWDILQEKWVKEEGRVHPFPSRNTSFHSLPLRTKAKILHALCEYRLDTQNITEALKGVDGNNLRIKPIGRDSEGNIYWYFFGLRLYKESPQRCRSKKNENIEISKKNRERKIAKRHSDLEKKTEVSNSAWSIICATEDDWHNLANTLRKSKLLLDKKLYETISSFLPKLQDIIIEQERNARRRLSSYAPRRCSSRLESKFKRKQEEEQIAALLAAEEERKKLEELEQKKMEDEKERKEKEKRERARRAEERLKAIEERANRARNREQRYELSDSKSNDNSDDDDDDSSFNDEKSYKRKKLKTCFHIDEKSDLESYIYSSDEELDSSKRKLLNGNSRGKNNHSIYLNNNCHSEQDESDRDEIDSSSTSSKTSEISLSRFYRKRNSNRYYN